MKFPQSEPNFFSGQCVGVVVVLHSEHWQIPARQHSQVLGTRIYKKGNSWDYMRLQVYRTAAIKVLQKASMCSCGVGHNMRIISECQKVLGVCWVRVVGGVVGGAGLCHETRLPTGLATTSWSTKKRAPERLKRRLPGTRLPESPGHVRLPWGAIQSSPPFLGIVFVMRPALAGNDTAERVCQHTGADHFSAG